MPCSLIAIPGPATVQGGEDEQFTAHCQPVESLAKCVSQAPEVQDELELCEEDELLKLSELDEKEDELELKELEHEEELQDENEDEHDDELEKDELEDEVRTISTSISEHLSSKLASSGRKLTSRFASCAAVFWMLYVSV